MRRCIAMVALGLLPSAAIAQIPEQFDNLKYFSADVTRDSLISAMRSMATALGVRCQYCHTGGDTVTLRGMNFAADDKIEKRKARAMLAMTDTINHTLLARIPDRREPAVRVACITCHRGSAVPRTLDQILAITLEKDGRAAAIAQYRELRARGVDRGRYDFGEASLNVLAQRLARAGRRDDAIAFLELNLEHNPGMPTASLQLAELYRAAGDNAKAIPLYEAVLRAQPNNRAARQGLEAARRGS